MAVERRPFTVAFETGEGFNAGTQMTLDEFYDLLEDYDAVIVHYSEGHHPSQQHYLLYGEAKEIDSLDDQIDVRSRTRSRELTGGFKWFKHGEGLAVNMSIGLHCKDKDVWDNLP